MTFGQLLFWIIVAIIAYYAYKNGIHLLIIAIAIIVLFFLVNFFTRQPTQIIVPVGAPRIQEGYYDIEPFTGMNSPSQPRKMYPQTAPQGAYADHDNLYQQQPGNEQ